MCQRLHALLLIVLAASCATATLVQKRHGKGHRGHHHRRHHSLGNASSIPVLGTFTDAQLGLENITASIKQHKQLRQSTATKAKHRLVELPRQSLGSTAIMSEAGYQAILATQDRAQMLSFVQRVLQHHGVHCADDKHLRGMIKYYNGDCATQSYAALLRELKKAQQPYKCFDPWILPDSKSALLQYSATEKLAAELLEAGGDEPLPTWQWLSQGPTGPIVLMQADTNTAENDEDVGANGIGATVALDQTGYHAVAALKSDQEMHAFIQRVLDQEGLRVTSQRHFRHMVPYYSGRCAEQSYKTLRKELLLSETKPTSCGGPWTTRIENSTKSTDHEW